jgi:hypothetical protein
LGDIAARRVSVEITSGEVFGSRSTWRPVALQLELGDTLVDNHASVADMGAVLNGDSTPRVHALTSRLCGASVFEKFAQKIRGGWGWARSVVAIIVSVIVASHHIRSDVAQNPNGFGKSQGLIRIVVFGIAIDDAFREANC